MTFITRLGLLILTTLLTGCGADQFESSAETTAGAEMPTGDLIGTLEFVESVPEETDLDLPGLRQAADVWPEVIAAAHSRVDVASFYFSRQGDGKDAYAPEGAVDRLVPVLDAVTAAAERGCTVRLLGDSKFQSTYPEVLAGFDAIDGVTTRAVDIGAAWNGVMHAKYFMVDDDRFYIGSQNWDWRALSQIRELGVLVRHSGLASELQRIYDLDWRLAGDAAPTDLDLAAVVTMDSAPRLADLPAVRLATATGDTISAVLAASPVQGLPPGTAWDLPLLVEMIDSAETSVRVQLLSYNVSDREGRFFAELDNALRRAAARRVSVQIILANWSKAKYKLHWIKSLAAVWNIEIRFSNIPDYSGGFIPFARVEHPKYMVVDGQAAWVGTSNWSRNYFYGSRNVGLFLQGQGAAAQLDAFFVKGWTADHVETVDPGADYEPPSRN